MAWRPKHHSIVSEGCRKQGRHSILVERVAYQTQPDLVSSRKTEFFFLIFFATLTVQKKHNLDRIIGIHLVPIWRSQYRTSWSDRGDDADADANADRPQCQNDCQNATWKIITTPLTLFLRSFWGRPMTKTNEDIFAEVWWIAIKNIWANLESDFIKTNCSKLCTRLDA